MLRHLYAIILGLSLFGNPVAVLESFAKGFQALFYEPYKGAVIGPEEFALGLGVGVKNFLGYTVGMFFAAGVCASIYQNFCTKQTFKKHRVRCEAQLD